MSYAYVIFRSSDIPSDWKCPICLESDQKDAIVAHVRFRYIQKNGKRGINAFSNGGERHPIHYKCLQEAYESGHPQCPSCREKLFDRDALSARVVTCADGTQGAVRKINTLFLDLTIPVKELPLFKESE